MAWEREIDEIRRRREIAAAHGGEEQVARHHAAGRWTLRERIAPSRIVQANSVLGTGRVESRDVVVHGDDATIRGGSSDGGGSAKSYYADELAYQLRVPLIRLIEGVGGSAAARRRRSGAARRWAAVDHPARPPAALRPAAHRRARGRCAAASARWPR